MTKPETESLMPLRSALRKRGANISSRAGTDKCLRELAKIIGPLDSDHFRRAEQVARFVTASIVADVPARPFVPLKGYQAALDRRRELCEASR